MDPNVYDQNADAAYYGGEPPEPTSPMTLGEHLSVWWAGASTSGRVAVLGSIGVVTAVTAGGITVAAQSGGGDSTTVPVTIGVVDCSHTEYYTGPDTPGMLLARVAVVDITNNGSTVQTVEVLANGAPLVSGNDTSRPPSTWTLQPGEMQAFSYPINPVKFGADEGQCWSFPFVAKPAPAKSDGAPTPAGSATA